MNECWETWQNKKLNNDKSATNLIGQQVYCFSASSSSHSLWSAYNTNHHHHHIIALFSWNYNVINKAWTIKLLPENYLFIYGILKKTGLFLEPSD